MKLTITQEDFDSLSEDLQKEYNKDGDGYKLKVDGLDIPDVSTFEERIHILESKNRTLLDEKKKAQKKAEEDAEAAARASGDVESIEKSWQKKYENLKAELESKLIERDSSIASLTSGTTASKLATELAVQGSSDALMPHIERRLRTEWRDGKPVTVVLDKEGNVSAMTVDELATEIRSTPAFAPLIVGSKADGAGHQNGGGTVKPSREMKNAEKFDFIEKHGVDAWSKKVYFESQPKGA